MRRITTTETKHLDWLLIHFFLVYSTGNTRVGILPFWGRFQRCLCDCCLQSNTAISFFRSFVRRAEGFSWLTGNDARPRELRDVSAGVGVCRFAYTHVCVHMYVCTHVAGGADRVSEDYSKGWEFLSDSNLKYQHQPPQENSDKKGLRLIQVFLAGQEV